MLVFLAGNSITGIQSIPLMGQPEMEARPPSLVGFGERSAGASHSPGCCFVGTEEQDEDGEEPKTGGCCLMAAGLFPVLPVPC